MRTAEPSTRECSLADLPVGVSARIVVVEGAEADRLGSLGIRPGPLLTVEGDAPFRGPRIVRLGAARIAVGRTAARSIRVRVGPVDWTPRR